MNNKSSKRIPLAFLFAIFFVSGTATKTHAELLAYWDFNDAGNVVVDKIAGIKGAVKGSTGFVAGRSGASGDRAIDFGSSPANNWVRIHHENNSWLKPASDANKLSVSFWQKLHSRVSSSAFWFGAASAPAGQRNAQAHVPWGGGNIYWDTAGCCGGGDTRVTKPWGGNYGAWNHFVFVKDGNRKAIYINGELFHEGQNTKPLFGNWTVAAIGANNSGGSNMAGMVDDFAVYSSALTVSEIGALAGGAKPTDLGAPIVAGGEVKYTVYQLLSKDYATIQEETHNGQDKIVITGIFPSSNEIKAGVLERDWCVSLPEVELKKLKFGGGSLCINIDKQTLTGEASCEPAFLGGGSIAGSFTAGREGLRDIALVGDELGIPIGTTPGMLQKIGASLNNLHLNPGWSVTGNLGISVGKKKIAGEWPVYVDSSATWHSNGYLQIESTLDVIGITTGRGMLKYTPAERDFYAEAWMSMYFGALEGTVTLHCKPNYFNGHFGMVVKIPNSIPVIGGINFGGANCDMTITDKYWQVAAGVWFQVVPDIPEICIPEVCVNWSIPCPRIKCSWGGCSYWTHWHRGRTCTPRLCTPAINNSWSKVKFNVRYHSQSGFSAAERGNLAKMYSANLKREPWENPFVSIIEVPEEKAYAVFNDNWDVLYESVTLAGNRNIRKQGPTVETIEVTEDLASAIFRLSFENEVEDLDLLLITPDGAELDVHDGPMPFGFTEGAKGMAVINGNAKEAYFLLNDVKAGPYDLVIGDKTPLGGTLVELVSPNAVPQALGVVASEAGARDGTVIPNQFDIDWAYFDADEGDNTVISFYVDKDRKGFDGHIVGGGLLSEIDPDESFTFLTDSLGLRPGWYYTYLEVNDGRNTPERIYSDDRIYIDMDNAPDSVETMATIAGANQFTVSWDTVADERAKYYNIVYSKSPTFDNIAGSQMAHLQWPGQSKFERVTVGGLENGVPYYVAVLSVDDNFGESAPKVIQRVVPTPYPGGTPPVITSDPKKKATAGYQWYYRPTFFDGDEHNPEIVENIGEQVRTEIDWELVMAPSGMSIDKASGLVTWKPTTNQEGQHRVVISAKEHKGEGDPLKEGEFTFDVHNQIAIQEFEINVFPPHLLNGVPYLEDTLTFVSEPVITAVGGKLYTYEPQVYANDQAYELFVLNGPEGIHIEDNIVKWDVPVDGKSDFIELRAETDAGNFIEQTYFVHVHSEQGVLPLETSIVMHEPLKGGMVIGWVGAANNYQIQRASSLTPDANGIINWTDVGDPHGNGPVNFYIEEKQIGESGYYRIKDLE